MIPLALTSTDSMVSRASGRSAGSCCTGSTYVADGVRDGIHFYLLLVKADTTAVR